ncbi:MAG: hypothetical protein EXR98_16345 [Gemmataceae bacterium]|nr:hypothetical protein [Gemmataceae bacterium]
MPIALTCACGQQQTVANTAAGQTLACVGCGKALTVPAMGVLASTRTKSKPAVPRSFRRSAAVLTALCALVLLPTGAALVWWLTREQSIEPTPIAQIDDTPPVRQRPIDAAPPPEKKSQAAPIEPDPPETQPREKPVLEPIKAKDPVVEPVKPKEKEPPLIEPVKPKEKDPVKPKEKDPPKPKEKEKDPPLVVKKPNVMEPLKLVWKLKAGDTFLQELVVTQKPTFKVQGIAVASLLQYQIVSRFTVQKVNDDGSLVVVQKVEGARLLQADDLTRSTIGGAVGQLPGTTHTLHLSPQMDVTKLEGGAGGAKVGNFKVNGGAGMQMASLLDRDGWKELAQVTFFQMDQPLKVNDRWSKPMTHNWGGLGSWHGKINYAYVGQQQNLHKVAYGLQLAYRAPNAGMIAGMKINGAQFQPQQAEGTILFDAAKGRVVAAEERFRVRGVINTNLLGQNTLLEIDEDQHFLIRIHEKMMP